MNRARTPERQGTDGRSPRTAHTVWIGLIGVLCAVEAVLILSDMGLIGSARWRPLAYQYGAFWSGLLHGWAPNFAMQPISMFASYAFLHADWQHLVGNTVTLAWLGQTLGDRCGPWRFVQIYAISALGGAVGFGLLALSPSPMVGASGAVMGLIGVWVIWDAMDMQAEGEPRRRVLGTAMWRVGVILIVNLVMIVVLNGVLAWQTHLGGFLAGIAAGFAFSPNALGDDRSGE
ncbi:MAG: rhomboid family intramembrane serine protease [Pseudooceanicola sp.]